MKTNLDSIFKTDGNLEANGIWLEISDKVKFHVRRFGGDNAHKVKAALAKHYKPYARLIENGSLDESKQKEITTKVFVDACLIDWQGVEIDGKETPFSKETAVPFLLSLPELTETLISYSTDTKNYKEDLGNS